jgi:hypothetical protein
MLMHFAQQQQLLAAAAAASNTASTADTSESKPAPTPTNPLFALLNANAAFNPYAAMALATAHPAANQLLTSVKSSSPPSSTNSSFNESSSSSSSSSSSISSHNSVKAAAPFANSADPIASYVKLLESYQKYSSAAAPCSD